MNQTEQPSQLNIIIAMPAYNEQKCIGSIVLKARQYSNEVIVVDDGSTDRTSEIARLAGATVIQHSENKGYGATIQSILAEAKKKTPDALVIIDADFQHNPDEIPRLIEPIWEGFDLVIGSRSRQKSKIPIYRRIGQKILLHSTRVISDSSLTDSESGFRAFSRKAVNTLELKESGMAVSAEIIVNAVEKGLKITERPISITYYKGGSTMNPVAHGLGVLMKIIAMISVRKPLLFFGLVGLALIVFGLVVGFQVFQVATMGGAVALGTALVSVLLLIIGVLTIFTGIILYVLTVRKD